MLVVILVLVSSLSLQEIDGRALLLLTQEDMEKLTENKLGPMTKIQSAVKALKQAWGIWKYESKLHRKHYSFYFKFNVIAVAWVGTFL